MSAELLFCLTFHREAEDTTMWMSVGIGIIQIANFAVCFDSLLGEGILVWSDNWVCNVSQNATDAHRLIGVQSSIYRTAVSARYVGFTFNIEFIFIAAKLSFDFMIKYATRPYCELSSGAAVIGSRHLPENEQTASEVQATTARSESSADRSSVRIVDHHESREQSPEPLLGTSRKRRTHYGSINCRDGRTQTPDDMIYRQTDQTPKLQNQLMQ